MELADFYAQHGVNAEGLAHAAGDTQAVIVALPSAMDPIRLVGDEEKHATLLYFGETSTLPSEAHDVLLSTLELVTKMSSPFSERVTDVSRLGSDTPPALVANLSGRNMATIRDIMQVNPKIGEYLNNATQHPNFTPHVTLGYPDYQGEAEMRNLMQQIYRVGFDRLALWWGAEQTEFSLFNQDMDAMSESVSMSEDLEDFLAHFGVKGMKWGIRRSREELNGAAGRPKEAGSSLDKMKSGSVITKTHEDGSSTTLIKGKDGRWSETHLSSDAEKFMKAHMKQPHEMDDRELRETLGRARMIEEYNRFFSEKPDQELKQKVEKLELQKRHSKLNAEMNPGKIAKVSALVAGAGTAYVAYTKLNKASGGTLGEIVSSGLGSGGGGKHRAPGKVAKLVLSTGGGKK